jgi:threonine 3-dehydrogenase
MVMSRNLITGGLGYVGSNLARHLLKRDEEVVIFDRSSDSGSIGDIRGDVEIVQGELGNLSQVLNVVAAGKIEYIYHLGAMISMPAEANPWAAYDTNANGTYHVLEAARLFDVRGVVFPSGIATYGRGSPKVVSQDVFQSNPSQMYAATKIFGERLGEYYHHRFGVNFRCPSFPAFCGPGRREGLAAYASMMVHDPAMGRPCRLPIDEGGQLPFIYVKDVVRCLSLLKDVGEDRLHRRVYSVQGFSMPAREMADTVRKHIPGAQIEFLADETVVRLVRDMPKEVDDTWAREDWGWVPEYDWDRTVQDFITEIKSHPELYE